MEKEESKGYKTLNYAGKGPKSVKIVTKAYATPDVLCTDLIGKLEGYGVISDDVIYVLSKQEEIKNGLTEEEKEKVISDLNHSFNRCLRSYFNKGCNAKIINVEVKEPKNKRKYVEEIFES